MVIILAFVTKIAIIKIIIVVHLNIIMVEDFINIIIIIIIIIIIKITAKVD